MNIIYVPLDIAFNLNSDKELLTNLVFNQLPSLVFVLNMFFSFNKSYYFNGKYIITYNLVIIKYIIGLLITDKTSIFYHYIREDFLLDLMVVIPFLLKILFNFSNFLMILRIFRVPRMLRNIEEVNNF